MLKNDINYKIYPTSIDYKIKDFIFIKIIKTIKYIKNKIKFNTYKFKRIYFYKVGT